MAQSLLKKDHLLTRVGEKMVLFRGKLEKMVLFRGKLEKMVLFRGKLEDKSTSPFNPLESISYRCMNSSSLSWCDVMESLVQRENSGIEIAGPLSLSQLKNIAYLIESELAILLDDLADLCHTEQKSGIRDQILINFPVMSLEKANVTILVNPHELVLQPSTQFHITI